MWEQNEDIIVLLPVCESYECPLRRSGMNYWALAAFSRVQHSGSTLFSFLDLVQSGTYRLAKQVFFKPRNCVIILCQALTLHCLAIVFPNCLLAADSRGKKPSPFSQLGSFGAFTIKIINIIIVTKMIIMTKKLE